MKKLLIAAFIMSSSVVVAADTGIEIFPPVVPVGLKDCKFYKLMWDTGFLTFKNLTITRCPLSATSTGYVLNKVQQDITVIDEVAIAKKAALDKLTAEEKQLLGVKE